MMEDPMIPIEYGELQYAEDDLGERNDVMNAREDQDSHDVD